MTARGFREAEMEETADIVDAVLSHTSDERTLPEARCRVRELCLRFPYVYGSLGKRVIV